MADEELPNNVIRLIHRNCFECVNHSYGPRGLWCHEFSEFLINDLVAEECEAYEA